MRRKEAGIVTTDIDARVRLVGKVPALPLGVRRRFGPHIVVTKNMTKDAAGKIVGIDSTEERFDYAPSLVAWAEELATRVAAEQRALIAEQVDMSAEQLDAYERHLQHEHAANLARETAQELDAALAAQANA